MRDLTWANTTECLVIKERNIDDLVDAMNTFFDDRWRLWGGVFKDDDSGMWCQLMVREYQE